MYRVTVLDLAMIFIEYYAAKQKYDQNLFVC